MKAFALIVACVVVAAVVIANLGHAKQVFGFLDYVPGRDVTGHFGLFGLLSFSVNSWLAASGRARTRVTAGLAVLVVLEELSQAVIPARTFSLLDLSASLAGLVVGAAASFWLALARRRRSAFSVTVCLLSSSLPGCQAPTHAESFVPGLGEIMSLTQMRHLKLWFAGQAENWELAAYETDELAEGFAAVVRFHPTHEGSPTPLSQLVPEFTAGPIEALRSAIHRRDLAAFTTAYDALTQGCNGCHRAADFSFNVIERPSANPYSNQRFQPVR